VPTYGDLKQRHPEVAEDYWAQLRALYSGGHRLLRDKSVMDALFPAHLAEEQDVYAERRQRAYYLPYAGEVIDQIVSGLFSDPLRVSKEGEDGNPEELDEYYKGFLEDCSPPGGRAVPFDQYLRSVMLDALQLRRAWSLVELPDPGETPPANRLEEESSGQLNAYLCRVPAEHVYDWETDKNGELEWAILHDQECKRSGLSGGRNQITETWTYYTRESWQRFAITYAADKPPADKEDVPLVGSGQLSFGRVPLLPLELPEGFWAMDKLASIAVTHMNKRNALSWAEYKSLYPLLVHFQQEDALSALPGGQGAVAKQRSGQGYVIDAREKDRLEYIGPDPAAFKVAMDDLAFLRDEMHRVVHHMALSVDNSGAALQRSADSKQVDQAATAIFLRELGSYLRQHALQLLQLVERGRKDQAQQWSVDGMSKFQEESTDALVTQAEKIEVLRIPSPTFQRRWRFLLAQRSLGANASEEDLAAIREELEKNITDEEMLPGADPTSSDQLLQDRHREEDREAEREARRDKSEFPAVD
jgi:hypothetical protein